METVVPRKPDEAASQVAETASMIAVAQRPPWGFGRGPRLAHNRVFRLAAGGSGGSGGSVTRITGPKDPPTNHRGVLLLRKVNLMADSKQEPDRAEQLRRDAIAQAEEAARKEQQKQGK